MVKEILEKEDDVTFAPEGPVLSSTFRPRKKWLDKIGEGDKESYRGPWRAVYKKEDGRIIKYASRKDTAVEIEINRTSDEYVAEIDPEVIEAYFDEQINDSDEASTGEISSHVEEMLQDLGYVR